MIAYASQLWRRSTAKAAERGRNGERRSEREEELAFAWEVFRHTRPDPAAYPWHRERYRALERLTLLIELDRSKLL